MKGLKQSNPVKLIYMQQLVIQQCYKATAGKVEGFGTSIVEELVKGKYYLNKALKEGDKLFKFGQYNELFSVHLDLCYFLSGLEEDFEDEDEWIEWKDEERRGRPEEIYLPRNNKGLKAATIFRDNFMKGIKVTNKEDPSGSAKVIAITNAAFFKI